MSEDKGGYVEPITNCPHVRYNFYWPIVKHALTSHYKSLQKFLQTF